MSDPTVQYALRDAEYATLGAARSHMERGVALRKRILSDPSTRILPKHAPPGDQPPPPFLHKTAVNRYAPTSANERKEARMKTVHDRRHSPFPELYDGDGEDQLDDHHDLFPKIPYKMIKLKLPSVINILVLLPLPHMRCSNPFYFLAELHVILRKWDFYCPYGPLHDYLTFLTYCKCFYPYYRHPWC